LLPCFGDLSNEMRENGTIRLKHVLFGGIIGFVSDGYCAGLGNCIYTT
jgi:hypothetical protein